MTEATDGMIVVIMIIKTEDDIRPDPGTMTTIEDMIGRPLVIALLPLSGVELLHHHHAVSAMTVTVVSGVHLVAPSPHTIATETKADPHPHTGALRPGITENAGAEGHPLQVTASGEDQTRTRGTNPTEIAPGPHQETTRTAHRSAGFLDVLPVIGLVTDPDQGSNAAPVHSTDPTALRPRTPEAPATATTAATTQISL